MNLLGALVNGVAASAGGLLGLIFRKRISEELGNFLMMGMGLCVLLVGIQGMMGAGSVVTITICMGLGGAIGHAIDIDGLVGRFGAWVQRHLGPAATAERKAAEPSFARGFVNATLFICVGSMAIVGSLEAGLEGDAATLYAKSLIDCIVCMLLGATMGSGVVASGICVLAYEAILTAGAGALQPLLSDAVVDQMLVTGSLLLLAIGFNMMKVTDIKVANFLPAAFLPIVVYPLLALVPGLV